MDCDLRIGYFLQFSGTTNMVDVRMSKNNMANIRRIFLKFFNIANNSFRVPGQTRIYHHQSRIRVDQIAISSYHAIDPMDIRVIFTG